MKVIQLGVFGQALTNINKSSSDYFIPKVGEPLVSLVSRKQQMPVKSDIYNTWKLQILLDHSCMRNIKHEPFPSLVQHRTAGLEQQQQQEAPMSWLSATSVQEEDQSNI